jgi:hypothetical protein
MGDQSATFVLSHPSGLTALSAYCEALQARSVRLRAEAGLLTDRLNGLNAASAKLVATFSPIKGRLRGTSRLFESPVPTGEEER